MSIYTGSGNSFFGGSGATSKSIYHLHNTPGILPPHPFVPDTITNPYGKKPFANFIAGLQADIVLPQKWMLILSTQYEQTGGKLTADTVYSTTGPSKVNGKYQRRYDFISINPQIGKIIFKKQVTIVVHAGFDYAFKLEQSDQFDYTDQGGQKNIVGYGGGTPETNDLRFTIGTSITRKRWSLDFNYKHGLSNYNKNSSSKVFERLLHIRLMYAFLKKKI